ncbi:hypothetical protein JKP88DRAFT_279299 [Tribonema minus]|uniref:Uncharacterized protein n=1 Tax=Tribonema minus TaxID=303371 RepID=A0A835YT85_9STRA|nr:hypothetical protein JKP88DRAFT_279299 [Tribonema minus]
MCNRFSGTESLLVSLWLQQQEEEAKARITIMTTGPESSADYLERVSLKALMEWLTAKCILHRPDDPLQFCSTLMRDKLEARGDRQYDRRATAHYLSECYEEAMVNANEFGIITNASTVKRHSSRGSKSPKPAGALHNAASAAVTASGGAECDGQAVEACLMPLAGALNDVSEGCTIEAMAEGIVACAMKAFNAEQAVMYLAQGPSASLVRSGAGPVAAKQTLPAGTGVLGAAALPGAALGDTPTASLMCAPLPVAPPVSSAAAARSSSVGIGAQAGVLAVGNRRGGGGFRAGEARAFAAFCAMAAAVMSHADIYERKERECVKYRSMMEIITATNQQDMGVHHILYTISACLPRVCDAHKCTTFIVDEEHQELWAVQGEINIRMPKDRGIAGAVATSGKLINIPDAYADPRFNQQKER